MNPVSGVYPWQQGLWRHLVAYIEQQRIPQALLVSGTKGLGKRHLANTFAASLLCQARLPDNLACGRCHACKLLAAQNHSDFILVEPDEPGKNIGIDKIRQLIGKLALKPQFEMQRVVIISPADQLNTASANAFLKCLEEPTERTCLILLTEQPARLPATIRSRCQTIHCQSPEPSVAEQWLRQQGIASESGLLLSLAQQAPLVAKEYAEQNVLASRQASFEAWVGVAEGRNNLVTLAEQWQKPDAPALPLLLKWMSSWVADIVKLRYRTDSANLQNSDMKNSLQAFAERLELKGLYRFYDSLLLAQSQISTQINKQLMLEQILISWSQLNKR